MDYDLSALRAAGAEETALRLADSVALLHYGSPRLRIRVGDSSITGASYDLGDHVVLSDLQVEGSWLLDRDGNRVPSADVGSRVDFAGMITSRRLDLSSMSYELELTLTAYRTGDVVRLRAPSGVVVGSFGGTSIEHEEDAFAGSPRDAETFEPGDQITLWSRSGALLDGDVKVITGIATDTITITSAWSVTPSAGDVIRLATYDDYDNDSRFSFDNRPFVWLGDADGLVGSALNGPLIYGGSLGV